MHCTQSCRLRLHLRLRKTLSCLVWWSYRKTSLDRTSGSLSWNFWQGLESSPSLYSFGWPRFLWANLKGRASSQGLTDAASSPGFGLMQPRFRVSDRGQIQPRVPRPRDLVSGLSSDLRELTGFVLLKSVTRVGADGWLPESGPKESLRVGD